MNRAISLDELHALLGLEGEEEIVDVYIDVENNIVITIVEIDS